MHNPCVIFVFLVLLGVVLANPTFYKRKDNDTYEADLVPVSSTVIPLSVYDISYGLDEKPRDELLKKLRKKVKHIDDDEDPSTLITLKKKYYDPNKTKVKDA